MFPPKGWRVEDLGALYGGAGTTVREKGRRRSSSAGDKIVVYGLVKDLSGPCPPPGKLLVETNRGVEAMEIKKLVELGLL